MNYMFVLRKDRSTYDAIFVIRNAIEKYGSEFYAVFIDLTAAYDHIPHDFFAKYLAATRLLKFSVAVGKVILKVQPYLISTLTLF